MLVRIKKILSLLRSIKNFPLFLYRLCHGMRWNLPKGLVTRYRKMNINSYINKGIDLEWVETYDGSSQCCHPSMVSYNGKKYLVVTPYPYGMEEYENPWMLTGELDGLEPLEDEPLDCPDKRKPGNHLSDPCLFVAGDTLMCFYRNTIKEGNEIKNVILYRSYQDGQWSVKREVISSVVDGLLSPAVIYANGACIMYYVSLSKGELQLKQLMLDKDFEPITESPCSIRNLPGDYRVWHIDVTEDDGIIKGLFLLKHLNGQSFKLFYAKLINQEIGQWMLEEECVIPDQIKKVMLHPYKSCYIPNEKKVLLSFKDRNSVWCLKVIESN